MILFDIPLPMAELSKLVSSLKPVNALSNTFMEYSKFCVAMLIMFVMSLTHFISRWNIAYIKGATLSPLSLNHEGTAVQPRLETPLLIL